jgi:hypothetical protein
MQSSMPPNRAIDRPMTRHQDTGVHPSACRLVISDSKAPCAYQRYIPAIAPARAVPLPPLRMRKPNPASDYADDGSAHRFLSIPEELVISKSEITTSDRASENRADADLPRRVVTPLRWCVHAPLLIHLTMRLSDARSRRCQTKMLYSNHRPSPWLTDGITKQIHLT